ncbi:methionine aminopeptidase 1D, chloroplastic/mitochondrial isoform X2 [Physcomitrium patens]|uniref:Methionine aminopeptidase n=1 Tax=Physcomitrium patens TaxID=3218 RepID=A0A2K1K7Z5_PHYPA|nr:methionine aminopeptidase 1D, chloroplastic/mitochondrial-like isoform X2 [Physcomitrium patens]PNR49898.1 hypothetical protein PHYPA_011795 [Physcomitrium patens]|eukprot:XP_024383176.1 methionine aminopeptidase 1D, chloroplastic/mitochondrial-like isoform X2 [Physcomitrella patens]
MGMRRCLTRLKHFMAYSNGVSALGSGCGGKWSGVENLRAVAEVSTSTRVEQQAKPSRLSIRPTSFLRPATVSPPLEVPKYIPRPPYVGAAEPPALAEEIQIHDEAGVSGVREAGRLAALIRDYVGSLVRPGVTTDELDKAAHDAIIDSGAYPSLLGFGGFPKSVSTSVNECICNGIPNSRPLQKGDIINIDINIYLNGYHAETSETHICGTVDEHVRQFVEVARDCLNTAIAMCGPGIDFREIGAIITDIADGCNYHVVEHVAGHGVGSLFHSAPLIYHCYNYKSGRMVAGQTFTLEPALSMGTEKALQWEDMWTTVTADGSLSAQFKHTVLITESGAEILTPKEEMDEDDNE